MGVGVYAFVESASLIIGHIAIVVFAIIAFYALPKLFPYTFAVLTALGLHLFLSFQGVMVLDFATLSVENNLFSIIYIGGSLLSLVFDASFLDKGWSRLLDI